MMFISYKPWLAAVVGVILSVVFSIKLSAWWLLIILPATFWVVIYLLVTDVIFGVKDMLETARNPKLLINKSGYITDKLPWWARLLYPLVKPKIKKLTNRRNDHVPSRTFIKNKL